MKKPQWIAISAGIISIAVLYLFARTTPLKNSSGTATVQPNQANGQGDAPADQVSVDSILILAKKELTPDQLIRLNTLEHSISRGDVKDQQLKVYHQLGHFWLDSAGIFELYAWYEGEASRLENSEKSLTFAARLFLDNLQSDEVIQRRQWKALQAKDLFERSLKINPANDSAKVGLGACYLFGGISSTPMEGILKIREVAEKDSTNLYAQLMLAKGSLLSGQYDKAISRLQTVNRLSPADLDAILLLAEIYERKEDKANAVSWYQKSLPLVRSAEMKKAIQQRIGELQK